MKTHLSIYKKAPANSAGATHFTKNNYFTNLIISALPNGILSTGLPLI